MKSIEEFALATVLFLACAALWIAAGCAVEGMGQAELKSGGEGADDFETALLDAHNYDLFCLRGNLRPGCYDCAFGLLLADGEGIDIIAWIVKAGVSIDLSPYWLRPVEICGFDVCWDEDVPVIVPMYAREAQYDGD